jgi:hypothetical protein
MLPAARCARRRPAVGFAGNDHRPVVTKQIGQVAEAVGSSSHLTPRWREMDSNFRFRASSDFNERGRVGLQRRGRVGLGKGAVERVGAGDVAAQYRLPPASTSTPVNAAPHGDSAVLNFGPCTDASSCSYHPGSRGRAIVTIEAEAPGAASSSRSAVRCS